MKPIVEHMMLFIQALPKASIAELQLLLKKLDARRAELARARELEPEIELKFRLLTFESLVKYQIKLCAEELNSRDLSVSEASPDGARRVLSLGLALPDLIARSAASDLDFLAGLLLPQTKPELR